MKNKFIPLFSILFAFILTIYSSIIQNRNVLLAEQQFELTAKSAIVWDYDSGTIIFEKEKDKKLPIASMVKLMTVT